MTRSIASEQTLKDFSQRAESTANAGRTGTETDAGTVGKYLKVNPAQRPKAEPRPKALGRMGGS